MNINEILALRQRQVIVPLALFAAALGISLREHRASKYFASRHEFSLPYEPADTVDAINDEPDEEKHILGVQNRSLIVTCGDTITSMLKDIGISLKDIDAITKALSKHYNVKGLQIGQEIDVVWESQLDSSTLTKLETTDAAGNVITLNASDRGYVASIKKRTLVTHLKSVRGDISTNFIASVQRSGASHAIANEAVKALSPLVNANNLKNNASFELVFEERQDANTGKRVGKCQLKYASVNVGANVHKVYGFGNRYYSESGHSLKTEFLVPPIRGRGVRISSKFGMRLHPIFRVMKKHCGVDYEAGYGTNVYASGNGVVVAACFYGGYGLYVRIRHSNGFETAYGHLSAISVRKGDHVNQGDRIGRVGSTGHATGPHLHHEVLRHQIHVDPQKYSCIGADKLSGQDLTQFNKYKKDIDKVARTERANQTGADTDGHITKAT
ncbi:MAG: M23 family metallopeptidase [Holosporales bacterium]|nr:M23 family metallopeptidase [Holosporales bacterium]